MKPEYKQLLNSNFSDNSKVWIYQNNRLFSTSEVLEIEELLNQFTGNWLSHGAPVKAFANLIFGQFIILMADETITELSGCSTDSSIQLIKDIEKRFAVNLLDRTTLAFFVNNKVQLLPLSQIQYAVDNRFLSADTFYFNNLIQTKKELEENWIIPVKDSWLKNRISFPPMESFQTVSIS